MQLIGESAMAEAVPVTDLSAFQQPERDTNGVVSGSG
jgi:hypothetical protein